jgi:ABC-type transport system substrate-binding protein
MESMPSLVRRICSSRISALAARALAVLALAAVGASAQPPAHPAAPKILRTAFLIAETNFDPAAVDDEYSNRVIEEILESPLTYDFLARPLKLKPQTLEAMPEVTDGGRTYTLHLKKGVYYSDDPAFDGKKRELVAADYEFAMKRLMDPKVHSPNLWLIEDRIVGVKEAVEAARKAGRLDYAAKIPGIEVLDRYTLRIHLVKTDYDFAYILAMPTIVAQAHEVVERYGADIGAHPVGTGAFRLAEWRRSSKIVLERNPNFREEYYEADPPADDPLSQQLYRENKGKRLPMVDRVEISIIEESQPRWLAFLNDELDWVNLPYEFLNMAVPRGKLSPALTKRGVRYMPDVEPTTTYTYYNMRDATLGGYSAEKVALRRAIGLAYNNDEEINLIRNGQAIQAKTFVPPGVLGYDPEFSTGRTYDPARAKALLDMYGYVDRDGDGWRDMPDGSPLVFRYPTDPSQLSRLFTELWRKDLAAIGIRIQVEVAKWPDLRKKSKAGQLQEWAAAWSADYPDGQNFYQLLYGPNCGQSNDGCFQLPEYDQLYEKAVSLPFGAERLAVYRDMDRVIAAYAPILLQANRKYNYMVQPWVLGWRKHPIIKEGYRYVDIDLSRRPAETR